MVDQNEFTRRVQSVTTDIISYYIVNPSDIRYKRLRKIIVEMFSLNEKLITDRDMRQNNWMALFTADNILFSLRSTIYQATANHNTACSRLRDRHVELVCGTLCLAMHRKKC